MKPKVKKYKRGGSVQIEPIEDMRKIIIEVLAEGHNMDHVHAVMKMDVTKPRKYLREYKRKTRQNISFTAFIIHSLAHAINTYKRMHAYRTKRKIYIFDEVDVGIGGSVAEVVGQHLRDLATSQQVICITHLPQVAAQAHHQLQVSKKHLSDSTHITVDKLDKTQRVEEIARMLGGVNLTQKTRSHAEEMLDQAQQ